MQALLCKGGPVSARRNRNCPVALGLCCSTSAIRLIRDKPGGKHARGSAIIAEVGDLGVAACHRYVVSFTRSARDVAVVYRLAAKRPELDVMIAGIATVVLSLLAVALQFFEYTTLDFGAAQLRSSSTLGGAVAAW